MEKKFGKLVSNVGKNAKDILEKSKNKAVQIADQNDDGKFDLEDVTAMAIVPQESFRESSIKVLIPLNIATVITIPSTPPIRHTMVASAKNLASILFRPSPSAI